MANTVYRIGYIASVLNVKSGTIRKWESSGVIAEPYFRSGSTVAYRSYTGGEVELIVRAFNEWWSEHWRIMKVAVPRPQIFRFGQMYWDLRGKYLVNTGNDYLFDSPIVYSPVDKLDFNPKDVVLKNGVMLYDLFMKVGSDIRRSDILREQKISVSTRMQFFSSVYAAKTKEEMLQLIKDYREIAKNGKS